jgi:hypothetical protein
MALLSLILRSTAVGQTNCEPLILGHCAVPFPSNFYRRATECDAEHRCQYWLKSPTCLGTSTPCGSHNRINLTATLPIDALKKPIDTVKGGWNDLDGFSALAPVVMWFGDGSNPIHTTIPVVESAKSLNHNAPRFWNMKRSVGGEYNPPSSEHPLASATALIDAETLTLVPHWVELDHSFGNENHDKRALLLWPAHKLKNGRRYIVAVNNLRDSSGANVRPPSNEFIALMNGTSKDAWRQAQMNDIKLKISTATAWSTGKDNSLQLAFDFTTVARETVTSPLIEARDDALARVGTTGAAFEIISAHDNVSAHIARKIQGAMRVPLYLNQANPGEHSRLNRDPATGKVVANGEVWMSFEILIPRSLVGPATAPGAKPGRVLQYGHGLFGDKNEVNTGYLAEDADRYGYILAASDWWGLDAVDELFVATMLATDITNFAMVPDRSIQGVINALMLMHALSGPDGGLLAAKQVAEYGGVPVRRGDGTINDRSYFGNSQGGILGAVYMAVTTDVQRGCIGVGGAPYTLLLPRSKDFDSLGSVLKLRYPDPLDIQVLLSAMQQLWDRADPGGFADGIMNDVLPNTPRHSVLLHYGLGDAQVTWLGAQTLARSIGLKGDNSNPGTMHTFVSNVVEGNVSTVTSPIFGIPPIDDTEVIKAPDSAIVGFDFGPPEPAVPFTNIPAPAATDAHEKPRRDRRGQDMMDHFFITGEVKNFCKGPCSGVPAEQS